MKKRINLETILWFIIYLLPLFAFFVSYVHYGNAPSFFSFVNESFSFSFVSNIFDNVWLSVFDSACPLSGLVSYFILCDIIRCAYIVLSFIPRFSVRFVDRMTHLGGGE